LTDIKRIHTRINWYGFFNIRIIVCGTPSPSRDDKKEVPKEGIIKESVKMKGTLETLIVTALSLVRVCNL
jgi:hypothetical protein